MTLTSTSSVQELIRFARENSPYYRKHYADLPEHVSELNELPVLDHSSFWAANTGLPPENTVITAPLTDGAVFRTGGTTAAPKASYFTRKELREGAQSFAAGLVRAGLQPGDRVANLLYGGDLYKGFLDLGLALTDGPTPNFHLSIGVAPLESQAWTLRTYAPTVLVAMPTIMCRLADYLVQLDQQVSSVRLLLYVGELLHKDQKVLLKQAFPSAQIGPVLYTSVDGTYFWSPCFLSWTRYRVQGLFGSVHNLDLFQSSPCPPQSSKTDSEITIQEASLDCLMAPLVSLIRVPHVTPSTRQA